VEVEKEVLQLLVRMAIGNACSARMSILQLGQSATDVRRLSLRSSSPLAKAARAAKVVAEAKVVQLLAWMGTGPVSDAEMSTLPCGTLATSVRSPSQLSQALKTSGLVFSARTQTRWHTMYAPYASIPGAIRTVNLWTISHRSCQGNQFQQDLLQMVVPMERLVEKVEKVDL